MEKWVEVLQQQQLLQQQIALQKQRFKEEKRRYEEGKLAQQSRYEEEKKRYEEEKAKQQTRYEEQGRMSNFYKRWSMNALRLLKEKLHLQLLHAWQPRLLTPSTRRWNFGPITGADFVHLYKLIRAKRESC